MSWGLGVDEWRDYSKVPFHVRFQKTWCPWLNFAVWKCGDSLPQKTTEMEVEVRSAEGKDPKNLEDIMEHTLVQWPPP